MWPFKKNKISENEKIIKSANIFLNYYSKYIEDVNSYKNIYFKNLVKFELEDETIINAIYLFQESLNESFLFIENNEYFEKLSLKRKNKNIIFQEILIINVFVVLNLLKELNLNDDFFQKITALLIHELYEKILLKEIKLDNIISYVNSRLNEYDTSVNQISKNYFPSVGRMMISNVQNKKTNDAFICFEMFQYYSLQNIHFMNKIINLTN